MVNFKSIIETQCFMFLIGEEQTPFQIHTGALSNLSPMMAAMIEGGMKESIERTVVLEDVEIETFRLFAEYAYTSIYRLSPKMIKSTTTCCCVGCGSRTCDREGSSFPYCKPQCREDHEAPGGIKKEQHCVDCGVPHFFDASRPLRCDDCIVINAYRRLRRKARAQLKTVQKAGSPVMEVMFKTVDISVAGMSHAAFKKNLKSAFPRIAASALVSAHAKLYGFADTYLIAGLKPVCLHLLHRDLSELEIDDDNVEEVIELIRYTYANTSGQSTDEGGIGEDLRKLVMTYVGWRANLLSSYDAFNDLVAEGGDFATDFMRILLEQLQS